MPDSLSAWLLAHFIDGCLLSYLSANQKIKQHLDWHVSNKNIHTRGMRHGVERERERGGGGRENTDCDFKEKKTACMLYRSMSPLLWTRSFKVDWMIYHRYPIVLYGSIG